MRIAILGAGHMGSWLAQELLAEHQVAVYDKQAAPLGRLPHAVRVLSALSEIEIFKPDFLINVVSLKNTVAVFQEAAPYLPKSAVICDMASIKGKIADCYASSGFKFVSAHPMFGPTFADMQKIKEENAVIIAESCEEGKKFFSQFFQQRGCRIFEYTFEEHDRMMAYSLATPFVSSMIFAACVDSKAVPGTTFKRHMDIARHLLSEDDSLLAEILFNPYSIAELEKITRRLEFLKHIIRAKDQEEARGFFEKLRENIQEGAAS